MDQFINQLTAILMAMQANAVLTLEIVGLILAVQVLNFLLHYRLNILGIIPRHILGLPGIIFSPILHGSFNHLFFNSIPLFALLDFMLLGGIPECIKITVIIVILSGAATWLFGRRGIHVGASSLIMGYLSYLLIDAFQHPSIKSWVLGAICLYYFGSFLFSIFPTEERTSWEGHLFGLLAGVAAVYLGGVIT